MYTSRAGEKCRSVHEFWIAHLKYKWLSEPCHEAAEHYFIKHILPCEIRRQRIYWSCFSCKISLACIFLLNLINYWGFEIVLWMLTSNDVALQRKVVLKRIVFELWGKQALKHFMVWSITKQLFKFVLISLS